MRGFGSSSNRLLTRLKPHNGGSDALGGLGQMQGTPALSTLWAHPCGVSSGVQEELSRMRPSGMLDRRLSTHLWRAHRNRGR